MEFQPPDPKDLVEKILPVESSFTGDYVRPALGHTTTQSIERWRISYLDELKENNSKTSIGKFKVFIASLLLRSSKGETGGKIYSALNERIQTFDDIDRASVSEILEIAGYRFQNQGTQTVLDVKKAFFNEYQGNWEKYFGEAKRYHETNFLDDKFLTVKGVGLKVRDLALSCFLKEYSANDFHVVDVLVRTGLIIRGYGDLNFGTNPGDSKNYLFLRGLIVKLSQLCDYSPGELDRIFWHFARTICKGKPECGKCPIKTTCLTYTNRTMDRGWS